MNNILAEIAAYKQIEVARLKDTMLLDQIHRQESNSDVLDFKAALSDKAKTNIIAEIKKASPSKGILLPNFDPAELAVKYAQGGAAALSVLTDQKYFQGSPEYLKIAKQNSGLPVLCKEFIIDAFQIFYARLMKADAVLLIVKLLNPDRLKSMIKQASELNMSALVEVHNEDETMIAVDSGAEIIGVNNRNLDDFSVSLDVSEKLSKLIPKKIIKVAESGIFNAEHIKKLKESGYNNFLIGEALVTSSDPIQLLNDLQSV
ncbi:MAG TPA: indole-3-glycerol phosphate synthase TrpC [candidate division Zixibacteria bacterium]|nr:indole-3-glycerol phosphate synthase TrpC [candidate division Zixibacteria bacterium]